MTTKSEILKYTNSMVFLD